MVDSGADAARYERGTEIMDRLTGGMGTAIAEMLADTAPDLARYIVAWGFGELYTRPGLTDRERQLVTLGMLTALGDCRTELEVHIGASLNTGLSAAQITEALIHASAYCGMPRTLNAVLTARQVFEQRGLLPVEPPAEPAVEPPSGEE